jgi:predicted nucleic acid-binding protein
MAAGVLDAGIAIAWIGRGHKKQRDLDRLYEASREGRLLLWISAVNLAEVVIHMREVSKAAGIDTVTFLKTVGVRVHEPNEAIARRVARLHETCATSLADGFAAATAQELGARLHTTDADLVRRLRHSKLALTHY